MKNLTAAVIISAAFSLFGAYSVGATVNPGDNISWTDNYGYSSDIFTEVQKGKAVMIFFGQDW